MGRKNDDSRLNEIRDAFQNNPNKKPGWIAKRLGLDNITIQRALIQLEDRGDMFFEDDKGRMRWFGKRK